MSIQGRTVLITGSTSGIGLGMVRAFAAEGARVAMNGLSSEAEIESLKDNLAREHGAELCYLRADLLKTEEVTDMVVRCERDFGAIDILVNNAGVQHVAPAEDFPLDKWKTIVALGSIAPFCAIRAVLPGMKMRGWGRILNMASAHALVASPCKSAYVTSKHALAGLTKAIALETAQNGITVNAIAPGYVWTPLVERQIPETMKARGMTEEEVKEQVLLAAQPTKCFVTIEQVAAFACFLASEEAASITGAVLPIDGGWTAQ